jgi:branched-subunit amino acid ABC-type transport system permease component
MQIFINSIIQASIIFLIAISFSIIFQATKFFHFAHAVIFTSGAYFVEGGASGFWSLARTKNKRPGKRNQQQTIVLRYNNS